MTKFTQILLTLSIIFTSCSSEENDIADTTKENLLQSYIIKRDVNGAYSIDYNTTNNTDVSTVKNIDKSNDIILTETNYKTPNEHSNNFRVENDLLKIGFLETNMGKKTQISIEDNNVNLAKNNITEFLNSYSITKNNDNTFTLNFVVNNNVTTNFTYNENLDTYEVHLANGKSEQQNFTRQLLIKSGNLIKLDFINYKYSSRSLNTESRPRKPRVIILNGEEII